MKRRTALKSLAGAPAAAALPAQQAPRQETAEPRVTLVAPDVPAEAPRTFFTPEQFAALTRLCEQLMPAHAGMPSAVQAGVPEFLDFLIGQSPAGRQQLYREGLDLYARNPGALDSAVRAPWSFYGPGEPLEKFVFAAKTDIYQAAAQSRAWAEASSGRRRGGGMNYFWRAIE